jgi:glyceraldehyde-3-phosphate dehydrogenase (NADP+) (phosphorylating)
MRVGAPRRAAKATFAGEFNGMKSANVFQQVGQGQSQDFASRVAVQAAGSGAATRKVTTSAKKLRVAINGFGRIGRQFLRCVVGRGDASMLEVVCVNDSGGVKQASHLLKYDSTMGTFDADVQITGDDTFTINGKEIKVVSSRDPLQLPWGAMDIDLVIEGTGVFIDQKGASKHLEAGAKKVLITAPAKGDGIPTYVCGVNADQYSPATDNIISNASCTTN